MKSSESSPVATAETNPAAGAASIDTRELRNALGRFATGVCIITTGDADGRTAGLTVNSFSSVSLDPPLVSWCLGRQSGSLATFSAVERFAVHVLSADQQHLARHFAKPAENKFAELAEALLPPDGHVPLLADTLARFECRKAAMIDCGDHVMFLGQVERFSYCDSAPLLFHAGRFVE